MRVLHIITRLIVGGAQENTIATVLGLQSRPGWTVGLVYGQGAGSEGSLESSFAHTPGTLVPLPQLIRPIRPWHDWAAFRKLNRIIRDWRPDIVHTHSGKAGVLGRLAAARGRVPVVVHTIHGPSFGPFQSAPANAILLAAERRAARATTHFISVADAMTRLYLHAGIGRPEQYTRIFSGFRLDPFLSATNDLRQRARWGLSERHIVVCKIARLCPLKGHDDLLAAAPTIVQRCPDVRFLLVGAGEWRQRLERAARDRGLADHMVFTGLVAPAEIPGIIGVTDILVHLSTREGLPRALSQALAGGRPVVAYDCCGANEVCMDGESGYLVRPGDIAGFVDRVLLLAQDPGLRARLGSRGRDRVKAEFGVDQMVDRIEELYLKLVEAGNR